MIKKTMVIVLTVLMAAIIVFSAVLYNKAVRPLRRAESETAEIAAETAGLTQVDNFYWFNSAETSFAITGTNQEGEQLIVIVEQNGGNTTILNQADSITEQQATQLAVDAKNPEELLETRIGMEDGVPVWEVSYKNENGRLGYYVVTVADGEWVRDIENI